MQRQVGEPGDGAQGQRKQHDGRKRVCDRQGAEPVRQQPVGGSYSLNRYFSSVHITVSPSRQLIFLPSLYSRPLYEIGTS